MNDEIDLLLANNTETCKIYNKIDFDVIPNKALYDKIDEYKLEIVELKRKLKAHEKIVNEQKNKIRLLEANFIKANEDNLNNINIIEVQNDVIVKLRGVNNSLYDHIKNK